MIPKEPGLNQMLQVADSLDRCATIIEEEKKFARNAR